MPLTFKVQGRIVDEAEFLATAAKKKPRVAAEPKGFHEGWRVVGHPAGAMEEARAQSELDAKAYLRLSPAERTQRGMKAPRAWDEEWWRKNAKKPTVRSKPYEIFEAAEQCAGMARKAGWEDVEIVEIKRVVRDDSGFGMDGS